jgi:putative peptide maturation dehydrogenase
VFVYSIAGLGVKVRRTCFLFFRFPNPLPKTLESFGEAGANGEILAISPVSQREYPLTFDELKLISEIPIETWVDSRAIAKKLGKKYKKILGLIRKGIIITDQTDPRQVEFRRREETLTSNAWNQYAALYHFMTRWEDVTSNFPRSYGDWMREWNMKVQPIEDLIFTNMNPPDHFHDYPNSLRRIPLPRVSKQTLLQKLLLTRRTVREFDLHKPLSIQQISTILFYVFGCHGLYISKGLTLPKKTSPSGSLHSTEVYPIILRVKGLLPGIYHYRVRDHSLELIEPLKLLKAKELVNEFTAGQSYPKWANILFVLTSRFYRCFVKYRDHNRAYLVLYMDIAHLSQTFYLVCTEMRLGPFFTAAINNANIEKRLKLDGFKEAAMAICGCGVPSRRRYGIDPFFEPYSPSSSREPA